MTALYITAGVIAVLLLIFAAMNVNAARAKAKARDKSGERMNVSEEKLAEYADNLGKLLSCATVADENHQGEFDRFLDILKSIFPNIFKKAELITFNGCLIFKITGKSDKNIMLMSHHDVAAADGEWKYPPYGAVQADGQLWGRGAIDTKTPLFAIMTAAEELLRDGFDFGVNVYIGSSANEEICGDGIPLAVQYFKQAGIKFDVVLDEGGAITTGMMPGVGLKSAMVAVHEKGRHTFICEAVSSDKGHLGLNPVNSNVIDAMSAFITEIKNSMKFKRDFYAEVRETFVSHAPYMKYPYRLLFSNMRLLKPLLLKVLPKVSAQAGGMLGTTMNFTSIEGGGAEQVQAKKVKATAFFRCVREEVLTEELKTFRAIADKHGVTVTESIIDYCRPSSAESEEYKTLVGVLGKVFPDVIAAPYLLTAGTDARHFSDIADCILRFAPIDLDKEQFAAIHNPNERIKIDNIGECVCFYKEYLNAVCVRGQKTDL